MRILKLVVLSLGAVVAACAHNQGTSGKTEQYVEIDNPAMTMSPNAPAKIFVPRSYVEDGVPRGSEVIKKGVEEVAGNFRQTPQEPRSGRPVQPAAHATEGSRPASGMAPAATKGPAMAKNRIVLVEIGQNDVTKPLYENLRATPSVFTLDPSQVFVPLLTTPPSDSREKGRISKNIQRDYSANMVVFVAAPEGIVPGKPVSAEIFDAAGGGFLRRIETSIPTGAAAHPATGETMLSGVLASLADKISSYIALLPWYGRITEVEGSRAYIAAGKESGLTVGQPLNVHRKGRFIEGLGYAPGEKIGTLVIEGFVGANGSFGTIGNGQGAQAEDIVSVE